MKIRFSAKDVPIWMVFVFGLMSCVAYMLYTLTPTIPMKTFYYLCLFGIDGFCLIFMLTHFNLNQKSIFRSISTVLILMLIYEYYVVFTTKSFIFPNVVGDVITWPLLFNSFFMYARENTVTINFKRTLVFFTVLIYIVSIPCILYRTGTTIFSVYYCISVLPLIYLLCSRRTATVCSVISVALIMLTAKRAAFIIAILGIGLYRIVQNNNEVSSRKKIIRSLSYILIAVVAAFVISYAMEHSNIAVLNRLSTIAEDGGSGRTNIWNYLIYRFNISSTNEKIFGHGFHSVLYRVRPLGHARFAHNSYIETLYDYGIVGLILLVLINFKYIFATIKMIRNKSEYGSIMAFTLVEMLILSAVSYFFEQSVLIVPISIVWGLCCGSYERDLWRDSDAIEYK